MECRMPSPALPVLTSLLVATLACAPARVSADEFERINDKLRLMPGLTVADVGAGSGEWSVEIARVVGEEGHVWATEITDEDLRDIEGRIADEALSNITPVRGTAVDTGLPEACCDAMLLRLVYHHFVDPEAMRRSLRRSIRPGGLLVVIEIRPDNSWPELSGVPDRGGHGIDPDQLEQDLSTAGFDLVEFTDRWNGDRLRYCSVFRSRS